MHTKELASSDAKFLAKHKAIVLHVTSARLQDGYVLHPVVSYSDANSREAYVYSRDYMQIHTISEFRKIIKLASARFIDSDEERNISLAFTLYRAVLAEKIFLGVTADEKAAGLVNTTIPLIRDIANVAIASQGNPTEALVKIADSHAHVLKALKDYRSVIGSYSTISGLAKINEYKTQMTLHQKKSEAKRRQDAWLQHNPEAKVAPVVVPDAPEHHGLDEAGINQAIAEAKLLAPPNPPRTRKTGPVPTGTENETMFPFVRTPDQLIRIFLANQQLANQNVDAQNVQQ
jgi:hypothetical protein